MSLSNRKINWFIVFLLGFFISETIYKYFVFNNLGNYRVAGAIKFIAQIYMGYIILKHFKENKKNIILIILIGISYIVGQFALPNNNLIGNLEYLNNGLFILITLLFFNTLRFNDEQKRIALKYFEIIVIVNSIAILVGLFFSVTFFKTYRGIRFGYDGFLPKSSYASYFYLISVFYYSHKALILNKEKIITLLLVIIAALLTGTKAAILSVIFCTLYITIKKKYFKSKLLISVFSIFLIIGIILRDTILNLFIEHSTVFGPIIKEHGLLTALFSYRNLILQKSLIPYINENWSFTNYLFGGMGEVLIKSGFDILDLVYFFGIIGATIYLYVFYKLFSKAKLMFDTCYFFLIIFIVSSGAGNFFHNSSLAIFLCAIRFYFELNIYKDS